MLILAFETSAKAASVALLEDGKLLGQQYQNSGLTHSQTLLPMAEQLLLQCDKKVSDLTAVAVAEGPGSFTGVRIGVAAAKGLAWGSELPCYGISTLEAMALSLGIYEGVVCACMDARRNQVYNALFSAKNGELHRMTPDRAIALAELQTEIDSIQGPIYLVGDGAKLAKQTLQHETCILPPEHLQQQRAVGVALLAERKALAGEAGDAAALAPNYLRLSQAERERMEKENTK